MSCVHFAVTEHPRVHRCKRNLNRWAGTKGKLECYAELTLGLSELVPIGICECTSVHYVHKRQSTH